mgnify:CR=1 FL=1
MSKFKHIRQIKEYNLAICSIERYKKELHKLDSKQQSLFTREFLESKIKRIENTIH